VPAPDPAAIFGVAIEQLAFPAHAGQPNFVYLVRDATGADVEVFRPPRANVRVCSRHQ
jgi:hypothetical protein